MRSTQDQQREELEARLGTELKHTLKLVPQSQRELFVYELARWYAKDISQARSDAIGELRGQWAVWLDDHADDKHTIQEIVDWLDREQQYLKARGPGEGI